MDIHVVRPGDTLYSIARAYGVSMSRLLADNQLSDPSRLVVGQTIVIQYPKVTYTVAQGDTLYSIARKHSISLKQLWRNNPFLQGGDLIFPGQELVISYHHPLEGTLCVYGYAYPNIDPLLLRKTLPYLTALIPFTYRVTAEGDLIAPEDATLLAQAGEMNVGAWLHISNLTEDGNFSGALAHALLHNQAAREQLISSLKKLLQDSCYQGVDIDFEALYAQDAEPYADFIAQIRSAVAPLGRKVLVAVAAKTSDTESGEYSRGHDYSLLGQAADLVLLMTYEWGYTYAPPMAVAPLSEVRRVVEYALGKMPSEKILLGIPTYGYDWQVPFRQGDRARSLSSPEAVSIAAARYASIRFDETAQSPWFRYVDDNGQEHEIWFEDARSIRAKLALAREFGLRGVSYWNLMRPFPQNWLVLNALYHIGGQD